MYVHYNENQRPLYLIKPYLLVGDLGASKYTFMERPILMRESLKFLEA